MQIAARQGASGATHEDPVISPMQIRLSGSCVEAKVGLTVVRLRVDDNAADEDIVVGEDVVVPSMDDVCGSFVEFRGVAVATVVELKFRAEAETFASVVATVEALD